MILSQVIHYPETNSVEATWIDEEGNQLRCHSYADVQMDMLRADLGTYADDYADLIALVETNIRPPEVKPLTVMDYIQELDAHLNAPARARGYDSIHTAALRAAYPGPWHEEGVAFATWMDACNFKGYQILEEVQSGLRLQPTVEEFLAEMPQLVLP